jgi:hypothetical protein
MIHGAIGAHVGWLAENRNLYIYLRRHARPGPDSAGDQHTLDGHEGVRRAVADHLTRLFGAYLSLVGVQSQTTETLAYAVVGMVESVTDRWIEQGAKDGPDNAAAVIEQLSAWTWAMIAEALGTVGVELDPDLPLPPLL